MKLKKCVSLFCTGLLAVSVLAGCGGQDKSVANQNETNAEIKEELVISMGTRPPGEFDPKKRWGLYMNCPLSSRQVK